jgi:hypothetical protein
MTTSTERKEKIKKIVGLLLIVAIAATFSLAGTLAKYTTTGTASDTGRVAKFDVGVDGSVTFDLFSTIYDTNGSPETDVDGGKLIAPGTKGQSDFGFKNNGSEVTVNATVTYAATNASSIPIEYSTNGSSWTSDITTLSSTVNDITGSETVTLYWRWAYSTGTSGDTADTALGQAGTATVSVTATATFTQAD